MARLTKYLSPDLEELSSDPQQSWKENWLWPCAFPGLGESHRDGGFLESLTGKPVSPRFSKRSCLKRWRIEWLKVPPNISLHIMHTHVHPHTHVHNAWVRYKTEHMHTYFIFFKEKGFIWQLLGTQKIFNQLIIFSKIVREVFGPQEFNRCGARKERPPTSSLLFLTKNTENNPLQPLPTLL